MRADLSLIRIRRLLQKPLKNARWDGDHMQATADKPEWLEQLHNRQTEQLIEEGFIQVDEFGDITLTEKGVKRAAARLDKLPDGDEILLTVAFCQTHGISARRP